MRANLVIAILFFLTATPSFGVNEDGDKEVPPENSLETPTTPTTPTTPPATFTEADLNSDAKPNHRRVFSGTIKNHISILTRPLEDEALFLQPGVIRFQAKLWCGDGDVDTYYKQNTDETYYNQAASANPDPIQVVLGYWLVPGQNSADNMQLPNFKDVNTDKRWFAIGYHDVEINRSTELLSLPNSEVKEETAKKIFKNQINLVLKQIQEASLDVGDYTLHVSAMSCNSFKNKDGVNPTSNPKSFPTAAQIASQLIDFYNDLLSEIKPDFKKLDSSKLKSLEIKIIANKVDNKYKNNKGDIESNSNINFEIGTGPSVDQGKIYQDAADAFHDLVFSDLSKSTIDGLRIKTDAIIKPAGKSIFTQCDDDRKNKKLSFWWESVPLQLSCKMLQQFKTELETLLPPDKSNEDKVITKSDFEVRIPKLEKLLRKVALLEFAQKKVDDLTKDHQNKISCINKATTRYINDVLAGVGIKFKPDESKPTLITSAVAGVNPSPEGGYATGQADIYKNDTDGNYKTIFMNWEGSPNNLAPGITLKAGTQYTMSILPGLLFEMNVRTIGSIAGKPCHAFCQNTYKQSELIK